ncbi:hypothetical protein OU995_10905 [Roseateles sp. SL47]|jgi:ubiquinone biosynthesis accessory factor UbiJ|uniref:hypothetical protein n=1 Tax=Roseateles sp. SL47 TaxID=2995138 RepID=UPI0022716D79|nr:hypothetical protein [Roseateles sp. SL47]WAC75169.1 hypothetical protein OU995_10905 [Roseateles sp. SL47]
MLQEWSKLLAPAVQDRITLLLNHVMSREPIVMTRLAPQVGKTVRLHLAGWPRLLPAAPDLRLRITPAGLLERLNDGETQEQEPDLDIQLEASNPAAAAFGLLSGERPEVRVQGDAQLAGEINWLIDNLRWDIEDDLAAITGPSVAHQLGRVGRAAAQALALLARQAGRWMPDGQGRA